MEGESELESRITTIRYMSLVLLGAGINLTVGFGFMVSGLSSLILSPAQVFASHLPQSVTILATSYLAIGIIYSTIVSIVFHPKHIISPLYIQITTSAFVAVLLMYLILVTPMDPSLNWVQLSYLAFVYFMFSLVLFILAGIAQTLIVRYLIGLNGTKENTNSFGLMINGTVETVLKVLKSHSFQEALSVYEETKTRRSSSHIFRTPLTRKQQLFIAIIADSNDSTKTQLATVSYGQTYYGIYKLGDLAEEQRESTMKKALQNAKITFSDDSTESLARLIAYNHALSVTESKLLAFRSVPPHSKAIAMGLLAMFLIMSGLWIGNYITLEMYETFLIFAGFSALFDLLPLLRSRRKKSELD